MTFAEGRRADFYLNRVMAMGAGTPAVGSCSGRMISNSEHRVVGTWGLQPETRVGWGWWMENS